MFVQNITERERERERKREREREKFADYLTAVERPRIAIKQ